MLSLRFQRRPGGEPDTCMKREAYIEADGGLLTRRWIDRDMDTDSSSDSASHTHSARRPSAAALLTRSRGGGLITPLAELFAAL